MQNQPKIFTIGGATFDIFVKAEDQTIMKMKTPDTVDKWLCFPHGAKVKVQEVLESYGGGATNTAITFARQGFDVCFVGKVGEEYGDKVFANLSREGVDCRFAKKTGRDKTGFSTIINTFDGDRTLLAYPGANQFFTEKDLPLEALAQADWIFLNHLTTPNSKIPEVLLKILKANPHIRLAWNPGREQIAEGVKKWSALLKRTEILFLNKEEAAAFSRQTYKPAAIKKDDPKLRYGKAKLLPPYADDLSDILKTLVRYGVKMAVVTDGRNGAQATDGKNHYFCPVVTHRRVDTLGAGDAFASGFTTAIIKRLPLKDALVYGTLNAAGAVMKPGAQNGLLDKEGMEKALKKHRLQVSANKL
ncbi:MAG: carbohydrate kinase family protein [Candidatus Peregrinibacteria bacterium]|nr:carbohydrate kinase family protein [Candidatus Peregrinibacteria bacterium]